MNSCGEFPNIANGQVKYSGIYATIGCDKGFHLKGDGTFKCDHRSGNHWSPSTRPQCLPVKGMCCFTLPGKGFVLQAVIHLHVYWKF